MSNKIIDMQNLKSCFEALKKATPKQKKELRKIIRDAQKRDTLVSNLLLCVHKAIFMMDPYTENYTFDPYVFAKVNTLRNMSNF